MCIGWQIVWQYSETFAPAAENASDNDVEQTPEESKLSDLNLAALQSVVDNWTATNKGDSSVIIYDLDQDMTLVSHEPGKKFNTASLYKLFVVYEGYRRLSNGEWSSDTSVSGTGYSVLECLDLSVRESYSPCAEALWSKIGHDELQTIIQEEFGIKSADIKNLSSDSNGILSIMKMFYEHDDINDSYIERMKDSFLNQPTTTYNWRQGLPSGFARANVYNKVGWDYNADGGYWNIYHDAAIVEIPETDRHFVVIVMTSHVSDSAIKNLGESLENIFYNGYPSD